MNPTARFRNRRLLRMRTPEGIVFSYEVAGVPERAAAWLLDGVLVVTVLTALKFGMALLVLLSEGVAHIVDLLLFFALNYGYGMVCEWFFRGQTLGKKLFKLRVIDVEGLRLKPGQIVLRNVLRLADSLPLFYLVGGVAALWNPKGQRLGDLAAGTTVVRVIEHAQPDLERVSQGKYNSLRSHPHLCARLRARIHPEQASVLLQAVLRRNDFLDAERISLYRELSAMIHEQVELPPELREGVTDEQWILNVVDVLYLNPKPERVQSTARNLSMASL